MNKVFIQIKSIFAVLSALFITVISSKIRGHQGCGSEHLVVCAKPLSVLTDSGLTFATSKEELDRMCPDLRGAVRCIHGYARHCMSLEQREHFKTLFHGTVMMVEDLCKNETYQKEYLQHAPCMKQVEKQNEICLKNYMHEMTKIESKTIDDETTVEPDWILYQKRKREVADEGIRSVCCSFRQYVDCSTHTMRRACGQEAADFSQEFLGKMSSSLLQMHCGEYGRGECGLMSGGSDVAKTSAALLGIILASLYYVR